MLHSAWSFELSNFEINGRFEDKIPNSKLIDKVAKRHDKVDFISETCYCNIFSLNNYTQFVSCKGDYLKNKIVRRNLSL